MNRRNLGQNHQNTVDRMRKKMIVNKGGQKICLILLIRNQSDAINNLLDSLKSIINTISIIDLSGQKSNDLIQSILDWGKNNNTLTKVSIDKFTNLADNKTNSIKISKQKFPDTDYFLLSELDYVWNVNNFDKETLVENKYDIINDIDYYRSSKLLSSKINWICHLNAYEYWTGFNDKFDNGVLLNTLSIKEEINYEKYSEKKNLLLEDLKTPNISKYDKSRIKFYLGYVFKNLEMFQEAIQCSLKRIEDGGCKEEIYYSIYNIGMSYEEWGWKIKQCVEYINKEIKTEDEIKYIEKWNTNNLNINDLLTENAKLFNQSMSHYKKAYEFRSTRSESLYSIAKLYRKLQVNELYIIGYQTITMGKKIKLPTDYLFVNKDCYDYLFDLELILIANLIDDKIMEGKESLIKLLNRNDLPNDIKECLNTKINHYK